MPNWCNNTVEIYHDDPKMLERVRTAFNGEGLLGEFIPVPKELSDAVSPNNTNADELREKYGYADWYSFCVNESGTKWEIGADGYPAQDIDGGLRLVFDSAWAPPCAAYEKLQAMGFRIYAMYNECGMCFAGIWDNGDDDYYEYGDMNSEEVAATLPRELDEEFCISETMAEYEAENQEIDLDDGLSATNE